MKQFLSKYFSWSGLSWLIISTALIWSMLNIKLWNNGLDNIKNTNAVVWEKENQKQRSVIGQDVTNYYCYLPAAFIHKDLTFSFVSKGYRNYAGNSQYWLVPVEGKEDHYVVKMSMGMSYLYMPFFLMAHFYTSQFTDYVADGFSPPYEFFLVLSCVFYMMLGFFFLRKLLLKFFNDPVTAVVMLLTLFATNLYYYSSTEPAMSHAYSFTLFSIFLFYTVKWLEKPHWRSAVLIGLLGGLIVLIRPVNILIFVFPLLIFVTNYKELQDRMRLLLLRWKDLIIVGLCGFIVFFPQLLFWKINTGDWLFYSYTDEHFFFSNPHILDGLFSYRKGWLVYTPIMLFPIIGIVVAYFRNRRFFWAWAIYLPLHLYVIYSWWCWWYGGSFGSRPMIETYAVLAIPMGVFIDAIRRHWAGVASFSVISVLLISLNLFQTARYRYGSIHYDGMTKESFWVNFWDRDPVPGYWDSIQSPDYDKAKKGQDT